MIPWGAGELGTAEEGQAPFLFAFGSKSGSAEWVPVPRWQDWGACGSCSLCSVCRVGARTGGGRLMAA